ncbi:hypothetical protein BRADI_4g28741v3 [Brachypodium distachyon]|uniref:Uncharacterized protein n=1 Tax=Brachypodium distachyon TaxID=15368 RepID=A0A2K2CQZ9_BRADI|nr:hypothetical protein BRADI_4g28741v3 [Brachypodium distachyon]
MMSVFLLFQYCPCLSLEKKTKDTHLIPVLNSTSPCPSSQPWWVGSGAPCKPAPLHPTVAPVRSPLCRVAPPRRPPAPTAATPRRPVPPWLPSAPLCHLPAPAAPAKSLGSYFYYEN